MPSLFVLGNAGLDIGLALSGLPAPGETLVGRAGGRAPGGKGLNQAVVAARCGLVPVHFLAPIGNDPEGRHVASIMAREPFASLALPVLTAPTDLSVLMVLPGGENAIVSAGDCAHALPPDAAADFAARCNAGDWLLLQGSLKLATAAAAIAAARARGAQTMLNTAPVMPGSASLLADCDVVVANLGEARQLAAEGPVTAATLITTLGAAGCRVARAGKDEHFPITAPVTVIDTTGAGDTFCGVLAAAIAAGRALAPALAAAQHAAGLTVSRSGAYAALPTAAELGSCLA